MTSETTDRPAPRRAETGWARARRLRGKDPLRTCLPAVDRGTGSATPNRGLEGNIVRGDD
ncbi:hypothetical protein [Streptomyces griseoloalbus]|uniref:hypothetical protein n=1 Tax=Streptomyces griseoloalbus TaxID=67303 RepID=UPI0019C4261E|nr:hypothetical protein [Streptomyces albaduncus]GGW48936.1 hypothetical protein GCM10010340_29150 [Streptomyces albaduncus]